MKKLILALSISLLSWASWSGLQAFQIDAVRDDFLNQLPANFQQLDEPRIELVNQLLLDLDLSQIFLLSKFKKFKVKKATYRDVTALPSRFYDSGASSLGANPTIIGMDDLKEKIIHLMKTKRVNEINLLLLAEIAETLIDDLKKAEIIGEIYEIAYNTAIIKFYQVIAVAITPAAQAEIDRLFLESSLSLNDLTDTEEESMEEHGLLLDEIREMRAIRIASGLFEEATFLKDDTGGWLGNTLRYVQPSKKHTVCTEEAITFNLFMKTLNRRGLLKHFSPYGVTTKAREHDATVIMSKRQVNKHGINEKYILDSWHHDGGYSAHLTTFNDWIADNYFDDVVSDEPLFDD